MHSQFQLQSHPFNSSSNPIHLLTPRELQMKSNKAGEEIYKAEKFKISLELELKRLNEEHEKHKIKPEDHPMYADEWKSFWERQFKKLKKEGKVRRSKIP
jgi:hypothetical protein